jgi:hypothetical protein
VNASFPYTVDVYEPAIGAYLVVARFATIREARAHWLALTLEGANAQVTRQS